MEGQNKHARKFKIFQISGYTDFCSGGLLRLRLTWYMNLKNKIHYFYQILLWLQHWHDWNRFFSLIFFCSCIGTILYDAVLHRMNQIYLQDTRLKMMKENVVSIIVSSAYLMTTFSAKINLFCTQFRKSLFR